MTTTMAPNETLDRRSATRIGTIVIARHGQPHANRKVRIDHREYREWWAGYDRAGLHPDERPPEELLRLAEASDVIFASTLQRAIHTAQMVAGGREIWDAPAPEPPTERVEEARASTISAGDPFHGLEGGDGRVVLVDQDGFRLGGALLTPDGREVSDEAGAALADTSREATRATRLLELGEWSHLTVEGADTSMCLLRPTPDTSLMAVMDAGLPAGQLAFFAERASRAARGWLERAR